METNKLSYLKARQLYRNSVPLTTGKSFADLFKSRNLTNASTQTESKQEICGFIPTIPAELPRLKPRFLDTPPATSPTILLSEPFRAESSVSDPPTQPPILPTPLPPTVTEPYRSEPSINEATSAKKTTQPSVAQPAHLTVPNPLPLPHSQPPAAEDPPDPILVPVPADAELLDVSDREVPATLDPPSQPLPQRTLSRPSTPAGVSLIPVPNSPRPIQSPASTLPLTSLPLSSPQVQSSPRSSCGSGSSSCGASKGASNKNSTKKHITRSLSKERKK